MTTSNELSRPPFPPFTLESAVQKARLAEDGWNSRDPERVALAYTVDSRWRNRSEFIHGREEIVAFLTRKWKAELEYRLIKELWTNENWEFDQQGLMYARHASINDLAISESERKYHWPLGRRPDDHPGLSELGF
jgi:uncharacterized protein